MKRATIEDFFANGRCPLCKRPPKHIYHSMPIKAPMEVVFRHRITEKRDCLHYMDCLDTGAKMDTICVPCAVCDAYVPTPSGRNPDEDT